MSKYTVEQIHCAADAACYYVTPEGLWLRMQFVEADEGRFFALDEDSGEEHYFYFEELVDEDVNFQMLQRVVIG